MTEQSCIRVLLADDHEMVRSGLAVFLEGFDDLELVGEANNGAEAIRLCQELQPNVVLMDLLMPEMDGIEATRSIRQLGSGVQVIALTSYKDEELVQAALDAGAIGFLYKNTSVDELANAIRLADKGKPTLAPEATEVLISLATKPQTQPAKTDFDLTDRETQVLALMTEGITNRQIAQQLEISPSTVKAYVSNVLSKLGVSSRTEAVSIALQHDLLS
ncbi:MAG: response regulator transcription factor [Chloroflexota bacterium]|jgi:NarL family two-component system response regulator LiaR